MNAGDRTTYERMQQTQKLLDWYDREKRILPWREDPTPYHVWLSEIMLQQTRVEAARAYYLRFLRELPDIASLAEAPEDVYLKLWEGLGYYSRVRNLHKAAVVIMEEYGGELPKTAQGLQRLPGIGPYSAAAIASIAFGEPVAAVDGNLLRVFARLTECETDARSQSAKQTAGEYYLNLMPTDRPGDFNQALMDLGAGICLPNGVPRCEACPWNSYCAACRHQTQTIYPVLPDRKNRRIEERTVLILRCRDRIAIRKRPSKGLLAGLYEFPNEEGHIKMAALGEGLSKLGIPSESVQNGPKRLLDAKHVFTHVEWHMIGYAIELRDNGRSAVRPNDRSDGLIWADRQELAEQYPVPSAFETYRRIAMEWLPPNDGDRPCEGASASD